MQSIVHVSVRKLQNVTIYTEKYVMHYGAAIANLNVRTVDIDDFSSYQLDYLHHLIILYFCHNTVTFCLTYSDS